jgi:hypothetical protein
LKRCYLAALFVVLLLGQYQILAQGCVAIRGSSCASGNAMFSQNINLSQGQVLAGTGFRYFKSFRHFRGTHQETERVALGTEVINHSTFFDFFAN